MSENVYVRPPTKAEPKMAIALPVVSSPLLATSFLPSMVMVQKRNIMVRPLQMADMQFTQKATLVTSPPANMEKIRAMSWNVGAPGGCPTKSLKPVETYSPQSHQEPVGSAVMMYTADAKMPMSHPKMLLISL